MMTNMTASNQIVAFYREMNGTLTYVGTFPTFGTGTGTREVSAATANDGIDPLASQDSLALSPDGRYLFAVNAGSNSISSFKIGNNGVPILVDVRPSGGVQPNSMSVLGNLLYVSHVGNAANDFASNLTGFLINNNGRLYPIPGATHSLSTVNAQPSQVLFNLDGSKLVVSELSTNHLSVFQVNHDGSLMGPIINTASGTLPFGSLFLSSGVLLVTEAGTSALSSYALSPDGSLNAISGSVPNGQMTSCWVAAARNEQFAYTSNTLSGTIAIYRIASNGEVNFIRNVPSTPAGTPTGLPIDIRTSKDGRFCYVLNGNQGTISVFQIEDDGSLGHLQVAAWTKLPYFGSQGLAVL